MVRFQYYSQRTTPPVRSLVLLVMVAVWWRVGLGITYYQQAMNFIESNMIE